MGGVLRKPLRVSGREQRACVDFEKKHAMANEAKRFMEGDEREQQVK